MSKCRFIPISMRITKFHRPRLARFTLHNSPAWLRLVPTEPMLLSYPEVLEQQPSYKGNGVCFSSSVPSIRSVPPVAGSWSFVAHGKVQIFKGCCQSSTGSQRALLHAELDTCSCSPWTNLVMCIWPGVKRNFGPLRNFWPIIVCQLFCFSE